ncbi:MAG: cadmium-translocating P-type ATPase, partial [Bacteroidales bacterium]|nr:cadmium-translocating P-type ATPase [Bacteroidales bacterium]
AVLPTLIFGNFASWLYRALMFLIVSCPCALVISVPLSFFGGIGKASRNGILIKGSKYMDVLASINTMVFDKTGTLTKGEFEVVSVHPNEIDETQLLHIASHVERSSKHPIAVALANAYHPKCDECEVSDVEEIAGQGIRAKVEGKIVCVGNAKMMDAIGVEDPTEKKSGTIVHISIDNRYAGHVVVADKVKPDARETINQLSQQGVENITMLTGDNDAVAGAVADNLGIAEYHANLLPTDKVAILQEIIANKEKNDFVAFVGDGINDAPVLALSDVGIAMGALGSDAAIEAADVVVMDDKLAKIPLAISIARQTIAIARQNVVFAIAIKLLVLVLAAIGLANMWMAVVADVGVTVLAILNAMRTLQK